MRLPYLLLLIVLTSCSMPSDSIEIIDYPKNVNTTIELQPKQPTHTRIPRPSRTPTNVPMATKVSPTATTAITPTIFDYKSIFHYLMYLASILLFDEPITTVLVLPFTGTGVG